jgi:hypothetical protein
MRRHLDPNGIVDLNCDPALGPERMAEARMLLAGAFGPHAEAVLRACGQAAAARRERDAACAELERMRTGARLCGIVLHVQNGCVRVLLGGSERLLARPDGIDLRVGQTVLTDADGRLVLGAGDFLVGGQTYVFCERLEDRLALVRLLRDGVEEEQRQLALVGDAVDVERLVPGDRVLGCSLQAGNLVLVTRRLGPLRPPIGEEPSAWPEVAREDIVGLDEQIERVERLFLEPPSPGYAVVLDEAERAHRGVVFQGVAGCGKTLLAYHVAGRVRARGGRALVRTASYYLSKWVGEGAATLRADFAALDASFEDTGVRPLLVVDELEAIALDRRQGLMLNAGHLDVLDTLLAVLGRSHARMIGISNVADRFLDTALTRAGRLPIIRFPATLTPEQVVTLVSSCLARVPLAGDARAFGEAVSDLVFAPAGPLAELLRVQLADGRVLSFGARDLATAATVADGIVRSSLARAAQRDLRAGRHEPCAFTVDELRDATVRHFAERAGAITRDNVRSTLPDRIPEDQAVTRVERLSPDR